MAETLAQRGCPALRFDFSHNGTGDDPQTFDRLDLFRANTFTREIAEIRAVVDWALGEGYGSCVLLGHSRGGGMALLAGAACKPGAVSGVVTLAAIDRIDRFSDEEMERWSRDGVLEIPNGRTGQSMPLGEGLRCEIVDRLPELDILSRAADIPCPCWHWHGTADMAVDPEGARRLGKATGGAVMLVEGAGHTFGAGHPFAGPSEDLQQFVSAVSQGLSRPQTI